MRVDIFGAAIDSGLSAILTRDPRFSRDNISLHDSIDDLIASLAAGDHLAIVECNADVTDVVRLRTENDQVVLVAVGDDDATMAEAIAAGADGTVSASAPSEEIFRSIDFACERRATHLSQMSLLASVQAFGASLAGETKLSVVVERVLEEVVGRTGAQVGYLVCEWEWNGHVDQISALHGAKLDDEALAALKAHPHLSPLNISPGRRVIAADELSDLPAPIGSLASLAMLPIAENVAWGRGGIVVGHVEGGLVSEQALRIAGSLASWAGVAIRHAGIVRDRNRAIEVRERILAVASHDLRNPLSVFGMALELLGDENDDIDERNAIITRAQRSVATMNRLISDLLDYAALDAGRLSLERSMVDPRTLATRALESVAHKGDKKDLQRSLVSPDLVSIEVDAGRLEQAITNLLTNAIKFTPRSGTIEVRLVQSEATTTFMVADSGPGIDEEQQRRLFDRYYTRPNGTRKGIGLGLSIARGIAESHNGSLFVESTLGEGAQFFLTVPNRGK